MKNKLMIINQIPQVRSGESLGFTCENYLSKSRK